MRKNVILMGALLMASMSMMAQTGKGGISTQMIQQMEKSQKGGTAEKALFNAIANNNIDDLVKILPMLLPWILISVSRLRSSLSTTS